MIFLLEAAFFIGRRGEIFLGFDAFCTEGMGAWSKDVTGS
jgi:hypothetical protein